MTILRPQFFLFGDSITQKAFSSGGWAAMLSDAYQRRVDIVNRGYSGYNTRWAISLLNYVFPPEVTDSAHLATVFFGANDAALPDRTSSSQHVDLQEFIRNVRTIVAHIKGRCGIPSVVLITPPPVFEPARLTHAFTTYGITLPASERTNEITGEYARAIVALGKELNIPVVNLWQAFQEEQGWGTALLSDGLHLTAEGNQLVGELILKTIKAEFEGLDPDAMALDTPEWRDLAQVHPDDIAANVDEFRRSHPFPSFRKQ